MKIAFVLVSLLAILFLAFSIKLYLRLKKLEKDRLTDLPNRHMADNWLGRRRNRNGRIGVIMLDINHFKALNDQYGHGFGDRCLREVAQALNLACRKRDLATRWGGDEFVIFLRSPDPDAMDEITARIKIAVSEIDLGFPLQISVAVGTAIQEDPTIPVGDILREADTAMYKDKERERTLLFR